MDIQHLITTASALPDISKSSVEEYIRLRTELSSKVTALMMDRPDITSLTGTDNLKMMADNHENHVRFIGSIIQNFDPEVLTETILWVYRAYRSHGFTSNYWASQLNTWINVLKENLSAGAYLEISPLYEWMQINIPLFIKLTSDQPTTTPKPH
jgi:hypothetical protein